MMRCNESLAILSLLSVLLGCCGEHEAELDQSEPTASSAGSDPGRALAELVLERGGKIEAFVDGEQTTLRQGEPLPAGKIEPCKITMSGPVTSDGDMQRFADQPRLNSVAIGYSSVSDSGVKHLRNLPDLRLIDLSSTLITDDGAKQLAQFTTLHQLHLNGANVGDEGMDAISGLPSVTHLFLANTKVTDAGLVHIGKMQTLQRLNLQMTAVTDSGLTHLSGLPSLNYLDVRNTSVTQAGADALKTHLPNCNILLE